MYRHIIHHFPKRKEACCSKITKKPFKKLNVAFLDSESPASTRTSTHSLPWSNAKKNVTNTYRFLICFHFSHAIICFHRRTFDERCFIFARHEFIQCSGHNVIILKTYIHIWRFFPETWQKVCHHSDGLCVMKGEAALVPARLIDNDQEEMSLVYVRGSTGGRR
jgi:hypothetical protein